MDKFKKFNLNELIFPKTDSISGREYGIAYGERIKLLELIDQGYRVEFDIDDSVVKAINDSFIKGLFSKIFEKYRKVDVIRNFVTIKADEYFQRLFEKNWTILQQIYNV